MFKALGWIVKLTLFSVAVLIAGDWIHWDGKTLSQHVRMQVTHAGRSDTAAYVRGLTRRVTDDARAGFDKKVKLLNKIQIPTHASAQESDITDRTEMQAAAPTSQRLVEEPILPSERQKLRALIHELNSSHD